MARRLGVVCHCSALTVRPITASSVHTHTQYTDDIANMRWDQWRASSVVKAGDVIRDVCWKSKACSAQGSTGSRDTNVLGSFQDLAGQSSEEPVLLSQLALFRAAGALGTSWSPCWNELSYDPMKHINSSDMLGFFEPHIKTVIWAPEEWKTKTR